MPLPSLLAASPPPARRSSPRLRAPSDPVHPRSPRHPRRRRARDRTRAAWRSCPPSPCRRPPAARWPRHPSIGSVAPSASSTPGVVPAMTRRLAPRRAARCPANVSRVDVEQPPIASETDTGDHRHEAAGRQRMHDLHIGAFVRNADAPEIDEAAVHGPMRRRRRRQAARGVGAGQSHRPDARGVERRHQPRIHRAGQHRDDDVERRFVGDAQPVDLSLLDAGNPERGVDLLAAAMHDDEGNARPGDRRERRDHGGRCARSSISSPPNFRTRGRLIRGPDSTPRTRRTRRTPRKGILFFVSSVSLVSTRRSITRTFVTAAPSARPGRASRSCSAPPGPTRPSAGCR